MGQLEKYGLYVLCLVIFLILGVALWGEPAMAAPNTSRTGSAPNTAPARVQAETFDLADLGQLLPATVQSRRASGEDKARPATEPRTHAAATDDKHKEPPAAPPVEAPRTHRISQGETFESIARQTLGDVRLVGLLRELNPDVQPERMRVGRELKLPTAAQLQAAKGAAPATAPATRPATEAPRADKAADKPADKPVAKADKAPAGRTHKVVRGDTLEDLARQYLGSARRVDEIKRLNPAVDPTRLRVGHVLKLPD